MSCLIFRQEVNQEQDNSNGYVNVINGAFTRRKQEAIHQHIFCVKFIFRTVTNTCCISLYQTCHSAMMETIIKPVRHSVSILAHYLFLLYHYMLMKIILQFDWINQASSWTIEMAINAEGAFFEKLLPTGNSLVKNAR